MINLDLGCGGEAKEGYIGIDIEPNPDIDICFDLTLGIPFEDCSIDNIYTAHFMEHLAKVEVPIILSECYRVMKNSGSIMIIVPHLISVMKSFINSPDEGWLLDTIFGGQTTLGQFHKTGFWPLYLKHLLKSAGFARIDIIGITGWGQECLQASAIKE